MYLTREIQIELFEKYKTPAHVQAHCNAVAETAKTIAIELNKHGYNLNVDVIYGAALVHDVLRVLDDHALRGAEVLYDLGFMDEGDIVLQHMSYPMPNDAYHLEEIDIVCIADRTVREDEYVGIDLRMQYLIEKPGANPERTRRILAARDHTRGIIEGVEAQIGISLDDLLKK